MTRTSSGKGCPLSILLKYFWECVLICRTVRVGTNEATASQFRLYRCRPRRNASCSSEVHFPLLYGNLRVFHPSERGGKIVHGDRRHQIKRGVSTLNYLFSTTRHSCTSPTLYRSEALRADKLVACVHRDQALETAGRHQVPTSTGHP